MRRWEDLSPEEQTELRIAHQAHLDSLPPTCDLETKLQRFARWLAERDIAFDTRAWLASPPRRERAG